MSKPTAKELVGLFTEGHRSGECACGYGPEEWPDRQCENCILASRVEKVLALVEPLAGMAEGTARGLLALRIVHILNGEE